MDKMRKHSIRTKRLISQTLRGRPLSREHIKKLRGPVTEEHKRKLRKPKSEQGRKNMKKASNRPEVKRKNSLARRGNKNALGCRWKKTKKQIEKLRKLLIGLKRNKSSKRRMRIAAIKRIEKFGAVPSYNPTACKYFKRMDEDLHTKGEYAMYGGGEHHIKELGYFVDYFNDKLHLIAEYDEVHHYNRYGKLKKKDKERQKEVEKFYGPSWTFIRIKCEQKKEVTL